MLSLYLNVLKVFKLFLNLFLVLKDVLQNYVLKMKINSFFIHDFFDEFFNDSFASQKLLIILMLYNKIKNIKLLIV